MSDTRRQGANGGLIRSGRKKRRSIAPPGHANDNGQRPRIWLDLLPLEVIERIARAVSRGRRRSDALHLARASPVQQKAVLTSLSGICMLSHDGTEKDIAWMSLFLQSIEELEELRITPTYTRLSPKLRNDVLPLLSAPNLRSASIPDDPRVLRAVSMATSLEDLCVYFAMGKELPMNNTRLLMRTLISLRLRKLKLACRLRKNPECALGMIERLRDGPYALARCCPHLEEFQVERRSWEGCPHSDDPYWAMWNTLPNIRKVEIFRDPPEWVIPRLRTIESVRVDGWMPCLERPLDLARRLGPSVKFVRVVPRNLTETREEIEGLRECENMLEMDLCIEAGMECAILKVVPSMHALKTLRLDWKCVNGPLVELFDPSDGQPLGTEPLAAIFPEVTAGVILRIVQQARALTRLEVSRASIRLTEIVAILKHLGNRLECFHAPLQEQHEPSFQRLRVILEAMIKHNRGLRSIRFDRDYDEDVLSHLGIECKLNQEQSLELEYQKEELLQLLRRLKYRIPSLDAKGVKEDISEMGWRHSVVWYVEGSRLQVSSVAIE